jgi:hypothetical protein
MGLISKHSSVSRAFARLLACTIFIPLFLAALALASSGIQSPFGTAFSPTVYFEVGNEAVLIEENSLDDGQSHVFHWPKDHPELRKKLSSSKSFGNYPQGKAYYIDAAALGKQVQAKGERRIVEVQVMKDASPLITVAEFGPSVTQGSTVRLSTNRYLYPNAGLEEKVSSLAWRPSKKACDTSRLKGCSSNAVSPKS